jgi:glutaconate CoA-transferase subunit A
MSARETRLIGEAEAAALVEDGMTVFIGGFVASSHPMAIVREIIRRGVRDLTVVGSATASIEVDLLIASGVAGRVIAPYVGIEGHASIAPFYRTLAEAGELDIWEVDESMFYTALRAAACDLPFLPDRAGVGTDYEGRLNPDLKVFEDPIAAERLIAVPAVRPDVAFLHAAEGDAYGNIRFVGSGFGDRAGARAATTVVAQVEKVISNEEVRHSAERTSIHGVDHVVRAPYGSHPCSSPGYYLQDDTLIAEYVEAGRLFRREGDRAAIEAFLERWIRGPADHLAYLEEVGVRRLCSLHEY